MHLIGLTGGVGMGKSTAAASLEQRGLPTIDTDVVARQIVEPGQPALAEVQQLFGREILAPDGRLRRDELARQIFSDPDRRRQLEAILHPRIRERWQAWAEALRGQCRPFAVVVIPLLFETDAAALFHTIVCVACSPASQRERLLGRGWTPEQIQQRLHAQWPANKKIALAHFVIWSEGLIETHQAQRDRILHTLMAVCPT